METVLRALAVYFVLLTVTRLTGRRSLAQITPFDVVLLLIIAETVQQAMVGDDASMTNAVVLIVTLATIDIVLACAKERFAVVRDLVEGRPTVLIAAGVPDTRALRMARVGLADIMQAARQSHGLRRLEDIEAAVLEIDGAISIIPRQA
jgi:uncharacterized membrane protein YcaP (DUF421 family)